MAVNMFFDVIIVIIVAVLFMCVLVNSPSSVPPIVLGCAECCLFHVIKFLFLQKCSPFSQILIF